MKILIVSTYDTAGGASKAAYKLHRSLLDYNIDSQMLVQSKLSDDFTVIQVDSKLERKIAAIRPFLDYLPIRRYKNRSTTLFSPSYLPFSSIVNKINKINPDIVHLQWIAGGMMTINDIAKINAPIVWNLRDMWPFTGGCHYNEFCDRYKENCGQCKVLGSTKDNDLSRKILNKKKKAYDKINNLTIVGLSHWIANCAKESRLFRSRKVICLPNTIDTSRFQPLNKAFCRNILNLPKNKRLIMFGAMGPTSNNRKGFNELKNAIKQIKNISKVELVIFGASKPKNPLKVDCNVHYIPRLHDQISLSILFSSADVVVSPSIQENLSNVILESLSCGTPVVAFDIGGNSDMIKHKSNGYLAKPYDIHDIALGIEYVVYNTNYDTLCKNSRDSILTKFSNEIVPKKYIELYENIYRG